jgi:hypothetical protein
MSFLRDAITYFFGKNDLRDKLPLLPRDYALDDDYHPTSCADGVYAVRGLASARSRSRAQRLLRQNPKSTPIQVARRNRRPRRRESRLRRLVRKIGSLL